MATNVGASIAAKLRNHAKANGLDMKTVLRRYAQERLLYRLSVSPHAEHFCLKGGLLLAAYNGGDLLRPTEDVDFNGYDRDGSVESLKEALVAILRQDVVDDGVVFHEESMRVSKDREGILPGGKVILQANIHTARVDVRVDVGFGNVITPEAAPMTIPTLLPDAAPRPVVKAYPLETVVSEKFHAIAQHGLLNTRMKDYFDIRRIAETNEFEGEVLSRAIASTFARQQREIPVDASGLSKEMAERSASQWRTFISKQDLDAPEDFGAVVTYVRDFLEPAVTAAREGSDFAMDWTPEQGWTGGYTPSIR